MQKSYKIGFYFDEGLQELKTIYTRFTNKEPTSAYADLKREFKKLGFEWDQHSGYISKGIHDVMDAYDIVFELDNKLPWLKYCSLHFRVAEVSETVFSFDEYFADSIDKNKDIDAKKYNIENIEDLLKVCRNYQKYYSSPENESTKNNDEKDDEEWAREILKREKERQSKNNSFEKPGKPNMNADKEDNSNAGRD